MYEEYIRKRITELRMRKNVSERCMSLDMGRSEGNMQIFWNNALRIF